MDDESYMEIDGLENKFWSNKEGYLHRLDGPACEYSVGRRVWYQNGSFHRLDGPALEQEDGTKAWYQNGKLHREDGPAIILASARKEWWINNFSYRTKQDYFDALSDEAKIRCLFSEDFLNG
jgi:hypothetical protein